MFVILAPSEDKAGHFVLLRAKKQRSKKRLETLERLGFPPPGPADNRTSSRSEP